jgi:hypothetical protein
VRREGSGRRRLDRESAADGDFPPLEHDGLAGEQALQGEQGFADAGEWVRVPFAVHALDQHLMRCADAEHEPAVRRRLRGQGLGRKGERMASVDRHDRGPSSMPGASAATAASAVRASGPVIWESPKLANPSAAARRASPRIDASCV